MLGGLGNMASMFKQAKQMQSKMKEMQASLESMTYEADAGAGAVTATVNGKMALLGLKITPETVAAGDVEMLEDLIKAAVAAAQRKAADGMKETMRQMTGGLNIPGISELLEGES
ncbi:MAG: YbaB/EbfC family nucleoid-associated protein [Phycisphaerae bacterium]